MTLKIYLTEEEQHIIDKYTKHLSEFGVFLCFRDVLNRIIMECGEELKLVEQDLKVKAKKGFIKRRP